MNKFCSFKFAALACLVFTLFLSCDKELSGYGNYAVGINNNSTHAYKLDVYVDGDYSGKLDVKAMKQASTINDCSDLMQAEHLDNIFLLHHVEEGKHHIEFKNQDNMFEYGLDFLIKSDACVTQTISFD